MNTKILIVDEDEKVASQVEGSLSGNGFSFITAKNGQEGLELARKEEPGLIILEVILPGMDGFSVCKSLRKEGYKNPIIFLTNKTSEVDAVVGLELGAQDYIRKPIPAKELLARVEVHLKQHNDDYLEKINIANLEIDIERRKVKHNGEMKQLTQKEFQLLYALAKCPNKVFSRNELLTNVWGWSGYEQTRTVDIHVGYLRKKFEENPRHPKLLQTIRGIGYTLNLE